jgi:hypothetical protein
MKRDSKCVNCGSAEAVVKVVDPKGVYPIGMGGGWCDGCYRTALTKELGGPLPPSPRIHMNAVDVKVTCGGVPCAVMVGDSPDTLQLREPAKCPGCGTTLNLVYNVIDEKGSRTGEWCHSCFNNAVELDRPHCARCGGVGAAEGLIKSDDPNHTLNGYFCTYCLNFLTHMDLWAESNPKAASYLAAFRAQTGGSLVAVQKVGAEVRRLILQERAEI